MKTRLLFILSCVLMASIACSQKKSVGYIVKGKIDGISNGKLYYFVGEGDDMKNKEVNVNADGVFEFRDTVTGNDPQVGTLIDMSQSTVFKGGASMGVRLRIFASNGDVINVVGTQKGFEVAQVDGNKYNQQTMEYISKIKDVQMKIRDNSEAMRQLMKAREPEESPKMKRSSNEMEMLNTEKNNITKQFITQHPSYLVSGYLLSDISYAIEMDDLKTIYATLDDKIKKLPVGKNILKQIEGKQYDGLTEEGLIAPDFVKKDKDGKMIKLSDYKGKYVLLDFWGSWCSPCRASHPHLREIYEKYKADGLVMIGVAEERTTKKEAWLKAIKDDGLTWTQIMNEDGKEKSDVVTLYNIKGFPTKILIDKEGKIIWRLTGTTMSAGGTSDGGTSTAGNAGTAGAASATTATKAASAGTEKRRNVPGIEDSLDKLLREIFKK